MTSIREQNLQRVRCGLQDWYTARVGLHNLEITTLEMPTTGMVNDTYLHTIVFDSNGRRQSMSNVLRAQPESPDTPIPNVNVGEQARTLQALAKIDAFPAPRVLWDEVDSKWLGRPFYVMNRLPGEAVFEDIKVKLNAADLRSMYHQAIRALASIHQVDWRGISFKHLDRTPAGLTPLQAQLNTYRQHLTASACGKRYPLLEDAFHWLATNAPSGTSPVLNWGDARIGNMLFDGPRLTAVLDWEIAEIAPREVDIGWFLYFDRFFWTNGRDERPGAMSREEIVHMYQDESKASVADLTYFERWAAFRLSVMRMRAGRQMIALGQEPADSRIDEVNYASVDLSRIFGWPTPH
jgi:aminoglycoside phosphotransferase (APT) family kinase protein